MPSKTLEDRVRELERATATLEERVANLRQDLNRIEARVEKHLDEHKSRRWDLGRLFLAAALGLVGGAVGSLISKSLDRGIGTGLSRDTRTNGHSSTGGGVYRGDVRGVPEGAR